MHSAERFTLLDGYRGVAALCVLAMHLMYSIAPQGYLAVDLFFVMSGYVIAHAYEPKLISGMTVGEFMIRRLQRLMPLVMVGALVGAATFPTAIDPISRIVETLRVMVLLPNLNHIDLMPMFPANPPTWSLLWELLTSFAYGLVVRRLSLPWLRLVILTAGILLIVATLTSGSTNFGWARAHGTTGFTRSMFGFSLGVLLFRLREQPLIATLRIHPLVAAVVLIAIFVCPVGNGQQWLYDLTVIFVVNPILVIAGANTSVSGCIAKTCAWLGAISYPVYIIQGGPYLLFKAIAPMISNQHVLIATGVSFGATIILLAWLAHKLVDEPLQRWFKHRQSIRNAVQIPQLFNRSC